MYVEAGDELSIWSRVGRVEGKVGWSLGESRDGDGTGQAEGNK